MNHIWLKVKQLNKISSKACLVLVMNSNHCLNMVRCACFSSKYGDIYSFFSQKKPFYNFVFGPTQFENSPKNNIWKSWPNCWKRGWKGIQTHNNVTMSRELWKMNGLKRTRRNFWNISHGKASIIVGKFSCHRDSIMWCGIVFLDEVWNILSHG
jgi:hypothetical protein